MHDAFFHRLRVLGVVILAAAGCQDGDEPRGTAPNPVRSDSGPARDASDGAAERADTRDLSPDQPPDAMDGPSSDGPACIPSVETCDGLDNDCDGMRDEGFPVGEPCKEGTGACEQPSVRRCAPGGLTTECPVVARSPTAETCNSIDDDCNGIADDVARAPCGKSTGECRPGTMTCKNGKESCEGAVGPSAETCDGKDHDCDGVDDNGCPVCRPRAYLFTQNSAFYEHTGTPATCSLGADGSVYFKYSFRCPAMPPHPYAGCTFSTNQNFNVFDADHEAQGGVVEVHFCVEPGPPVVGGLNLWYVGPNGKRWLPLLASGEAMTAGCRTKYFLPDAACYPDWDSDVQACRGKCGKTGPGCNVDFASAELRLIAEFCAKDTGGTIRLVSVRHYPQSCICTKDAECPRDRVCRLSEGVRSCPADSPRCAGVCFH